MEFGYRQNNKNYCNFRPIMINMLLVQNQFEDPSTDRKLPINTLIEEVKQLVMENYDFKHRF